MLTPIETLWKRNILVVNFGVMKLNKMIKMIVVITSLHSI